MSDEVKFARPQVPATRLIASVVPEVKMISSTLEALKWARIISRAPSKASVA